MKSYLYRTELNKHRKTELLTLVFSSCPTIIDVLNVFIDIQTSKELIQMDTDKMMTYGTFTMDDEKLTQS